MSILSFIKKVCVQTAVYWGNPTPDGMGTVQFDYPIEIKVRWTDKQQLIRAANGKEVISRAEVLLNDELDVDGMLYLGELDDFHYTDLKTYNPKDCETAFPILSKDKIPLFKSTDKFVNKVYL